MLVLEGCFFINKKNKELESRIESASVAFFTFLFFRYK